MTMSVVLFFVMNSIIAVEAGKNLQYASVEFRALQTTYMNTTVSSGAECCAICTSEEDCYSVNYEKFTKECGLSRTRLRDVITNSIQDRNYTTFGRGGMAVSQQV